MNINKKLDVSRETYFKKLRLVADSLGLQVKDAQLNCLLDYLDLLEKWNRVYNLTAIRAYSDMFKLHILDSMVFIPILNAINIKKPLGSFLDVGTGAGLPGLVIAILRPDIEVTMIEKVQKKVSFVTQAIAHLGLKNAYVVHGRAGQHVFEYSFDAVISRAFSDLVFFSNLVSKYVRSGSLLFAMKGKIRERDTNVLNWRYLNSVDLCVPELDAKRHVIILEFIRG